ncbi:MAG: hypothetical protein F6J95_020005 [Leptolyngbya sp. SIO1E4]|nr:hypothetical protein [Leptolyngbya sp. SIO1E4]
MNFHSTPTSKVTQSETDVAVNQPLQPIPKNLQAVISGGRMSGYLKVKKLNSGE